MFHVGPKCFEDSGVFHSDAHARAAKELEQLKRQNLRFMLMLERKMVALGWLPEKTEQLRSLLGLVAILVRTALDGRMPTMSSVDADRVRAQRRDDPFLLHFAKCLEVGNERLFTFICLRLGEIVQPESETYLQGQDVLLTLIAYVDAAMDRCAQMN